MDIVLLFALALHTIAFVIAWGYYGILGRIVIPALARSVDINAQSSALVAIERRALPLVLLSVVLFIVTGTYLLVIDPSYQGLGNVSAPWAMWMLLKHVAVAALVLVGVGVEYLVRELAESADDIDRMRNLRLIRYAAEAATALGAVVVLLTAAAQLSA